MGQPPFWGYVINTIHVTGQWVLSFFTALRNIKRCFVTHSYWYSFSFNSTDELKVPEEPPFVDVKCVKARPGLFDKSEMPKTSDLETLKFLSKRIVNEEVIGNLKYRSSIWIVSIHFTSSCLTLQASVKATDRSQYQLPLRRFLYLVIFVSCFVSRRL